MDIVEVDFERILKMHYFIVTLASSPSATASNFTVAMAGSKQEKLCQNDQMTILPSGTGGGVN